jgi:hypothetical protein
MSVAVVQQEGGCFLLHYCIMNEQDVAGGGWGVLCYKTLQLLCTSLCTVINQ